MIEHPVRTYTGHTITDDAITAAQRSSGAVAVIAAAITDACHALAGTEADLARCADAIGAHLDEVHRAMAAGPGEPAPTLNPLSVLQALGPRLDALTAQRATQISHLRALARIWLAHHTPASTAARTGQVRRYAELIVAAIDADISEGLVPAGVGSFADLHRYVDANDYLIAAGVPYDGTQDSTDLTTAVQGLVVARLRTPGRPFCTHGSCRFPAHDHTTAYDPGGQEPDHAAPMQCRHCGQPAHYDAHLEDYRHDDPAAPDCFLIHRDDPATSIAAGGGTTT